MKSLIIIFSFLLSTNSFAVEVLTLADLIGENPNGSRTPVVTRTEMETMTPADRTAVNAELRASNTRYNRYLTQHCTTQADGSVRLDQKCESIDVRNGDQNFRPELIDPSLATSKFKDIPRGAKVEVHTKCEGNQFFTRVYVNGKPFVNPYNGSTKWMTSPGQYNRREPPYKLDANGKFVTNSSGQRVPMTMDEYKSSDCSKNPLYCTDAKRKSYRESYRTSLPISRSSSQSFPATGDINQWHVVSDAKAYTGAQMPFTLWLNNSGNAYHAGTTATPVDGWPASAGCFRLQEDNAKGLFNLARRVGTGNMKFFWGGYTNEKGQLCDRPRGAREPISEDITPDKSRRSKENVFTRIGDWLRGLGRSNNRNNETSPTNQ